jgi:hypothetical protein
MPTIWGMAAKDSFIVGPVKTIGAIATLVMENVMLTYFGPQAYGTPIGNLKIAGTAMLGVIVAGTIVTLLQRILKIEEGEATNKAFWPVLLVMVLSFSSSILFLFRSLLLLVGLIQQGAPPPTYLEWIFMPFELLL